MAYADRRRGRAESPASSPGTAGVNVEAVRVRVRELVRETAPHPSDEPPAPTALLEDDLDYDSLAKIELGLTIERTFGLPPVADASSLDIDTVGDVERLVVDLLVARGA